MKTSWSGNRRQIETSMTISMLFIIMRRIYVGNTNWKLPEMILNVFARIISNVSPHYYHLCMCVCVFCHPILVKIHQPHRDHRVSPSSSTHAIAVGIL